MAANEPALVLRWMATRLSASAPLIALLADARVYAREIPGDIDVIAKPGLVVQHLWTDSPDGAIQTGVNTHSASNVHVVTRFVHQAHSTTQMEAVLALVLGLLDNVHDISIAGDGYIYTCAREQTQESLTPVGNESIIEWLVNWLVTAKAY